MEENSRILIIGVTGNLGFELAEASLRLGHPTFALVRDSSFSHPEKSQKLQLLAKSGASLLNGSLEDISSLIEAVKQVDVVICAVSSKQVLHQKFLIQAIKQSGCIKRFIPSEFGSDPDKVHISNMDHGFYSSKAEIRRSIEAEGIPHTFISCNFFTSYFLPSLVQPGLKSPPRDRVRIFGDGNTKAVFIKEADVATFTIMTVDDPRSLNNTLYLRPVGNVYSMNELVGIWETKIGKKLDKVYIPEEHVLKIIQDTNYPDNMEMVFIYSAFIKGDHTCFDIESSGVDGTKLYPHVRWNCADNQFIMSYPRGAYGHGDYKGWHTTTDDYYVHVSRLERMPSINVDAPHFPNFHTLFNNNKIANTTRTTTDHEDVHEQVVVQKEEPSETTKSSMVQVPPQKKVVQSEKQSKGSSNNNNSELTSVSTVQVPAQKKVVQFEEQSMDNKITKKKNGKKQQGYESNIDVEATDFIQNKHKNFELCKWMSLKGY